jgi:hypothetical protein
VSPLFLSACGGHIQNQVDSIAEGVGITGRLTANFAAARVDGAFRGSDREMAEMAAYLMRNEGPYTAGRAAHVQGSLKQAGGRGGLGRRQACLWGARRHLIVWGRSRRRGSWGQGTRW